MRPENASVDPLRDFGRRIYRGALARLSNRNQINVSFLRYHRRLPDLENPKTFSELVQWRKLNGLATDPRFSLYADKVKVKDIVARELGAEWVTPTLWHGKVLPDVLDWPTPYVVKANHAAGRNYFVRTASDLDEAALRALAAGWLKTSHYGHLLESHYDRIDPQLLVEPLIGENGVSPDDYKLFVFGGRVEFIQVDVGRFSDHRRVFYDRSWTRCDFTFEYQLYAEDVPRPASLDRMIAGAEILARPFEFVRLDFYDIEGAPRFGEATFAPESGYGRFTPRAMDETLGRLWLPHFRAVSATSVVDSVENSRIAVHIGDLEGGGAERVCLTLSDHLARRGYDVDLVLCQAKGPLVGDVSPNVRLVNLKTLGSASSLYALAKYLRNRRPVVMIANLVPQNTMAVLASLVTRSPTRVFATQHSALSVEVLGGWSPWRRLAPWLYKFVLPRAGGVMAVSNGVAEDLEQVTGFAASQIGVIYNPIEADSISQKSRETVDDPFFASPAPVILGVGRLARQKSFDVLIAAFARLAAERSCRLAICGEGPLRRALESQIAAAGLTDRVKLLGFQKNPFKYMAAADLFVLSSEREGFGNVLVEAMACGTQVVSTNGPHGPAEILDYGRYGELTPVGDVGALAAAMARALDNPWPKDVLIARANEFSAEKAVDRYLDVIGLPPVCAWLHAHRSLVAEGLAQAVHLGHYRMRAIVVGRFDVHLPIQMHDAHIKPFRSLRQVEDA